MSQQAKVIRLEQLAVAITNEAVKILPGAPDPRKLAHAQLAAKITGWEQSIKLVQRDMKSQSHFNHMVHAHTKGGPDSYAADQRLKSGEANVKQISNALDKVIAALSQLSDQFFAGDNAETRALKGIAHALKNWSKTAKHTESGMVGSTAPRDVQATIQQAKPFIPHGTPGMAAPGGLDIFTILIAYVVFIKAMTKKD